MIFNSMQFVVFFPIAVLLYFLIPHKFRYLWLLATSYFYYMCWNPKYALLLLLSTLITYASGLLIGREYMSVRRKKWYVGISFFLNLSILFFYKYFDFLFSSIARICETLGIDYVKPAFDVLLPVGISFYIFQALSYTMDVYRGEIRPERNVFKYALFVSFFPQLVAGPIERSKNLLGQFDEVHFFDYDRVREGLIQMLWGFFLKLVIAERFAITANLIYGNYNECTGYQLMIGTFAFAFQIYCDFASYSEIAIGSAKVMGFHLMENFRQPFFADSCGDLWRRWHISLNTWFRDYLYIPLGGSRKGKTRKYVNLMIVFLTSGLWHGANWTFVIWGGLSGLFQIIGAELKGIRMRLMNLIHMKPDGKLRHVLSVVSTFLLFNFSLIFFRSGTVSEAFCIVRKIFTEFGIKSIFTTSPFELGLGVKNLLFLAFSTVILLIGDTFKEKYGTCGGPDSAIGRLTASKWYIRWGFYYLLVLLILLSANLGSAEFIYFSF
ncbi:MBOAT family protein [bacterium C-53]|nr:MBOAT family protein [Lachnospiraceae bacterium]NBI03768.1 MBOAT family protein [Lachnospiraceae bacterium]RKJ09117.1 MBOAT family protein [bacterium C-53]